MRACVHVTDDAIKVYFFNREILALDHTITVIYFCAIKAFL